MHSARQLPPCEPALGISMRGDQVVIRLRSRLDRCSTETLVLAVAGATGSGATVVIELGPTDDATGPAGSGGPVPHGAAGAAACRDSHTEVLGGGRLQLGFHGRCWTLDLTARRFCRSEGPVAPNFVEPEHWIAMTSIWVTADQTTVVDPDGTLFSAPVTWDRDRTVGTYRRAGSTTNAA